MRLLITADIHVHNHTPGRLEIYSRLFDDITYLAKANRCDGVFVAGDVWDEKRGVNVEVLTLIYEKLKEAKQAGMPWTLLRGNHEIAMKSEPHSTLLNLFGGVARVITRPRAMYFDGGCIDCMPWYLHDQFIPLAKRMADAPVKGRRAMIAHIGLDEGQLSPSNFYRVPQRVSVAHLFPDRYDLVLLGDYHMRQEVRNNVIYLGTPIPQDFADGPTQGVWILEMGKGPTSLTELALMHEYPQFITHEPRSYADVAEIDFTRDYHRIKVESSTQGDYAGIANLENVRIDPVKTDSAVKQSVRLHSAQKEVLNHRDIFLDYAQHKNLTPEQRELGLQYLTRAEEMAYR